MIEIYTVGSEVDLGNKLKGKITEILIQATDRIQYKCVWWDAKTRKEEWLSSFELEGKCEDKLQLGFK